MIDQPSSGIPSGWTKTCCRSTAAPRPSAKTDTELIMARLSRMPTREDLWARVVIGILGGGCLVELLALAFPIAFLGRSCS